MRLTIQKFCACINACTKEKLREVAYGKLLHTQTHTYTYTQKIGEAFEKQAMRPPFQIVEMVIRDKLTIVLKA